MEDTEKQQAVPTEVIPPAPDAEAPVESKAPDAEKKEEPKNPLITPFVDLTRANVNFRFVGDMRPKNPKVTSRERLELPVYSRRTQLAMLEAYATEMFEVVVEKMLLDEPLDADETRILNTMQAAALNPRGDWADRALTREGSEWTNEVVAPNGVDYIKPGIPPADDLPEDDKTPLSGDMAIYHAIRATQSGAPATFPLWHSAIWLRQNPPPTDRVALMHERIAADKINGGRNTGGFSFSATSIISNKHAIEMALETCYGANVEVKDVQKLMEIIPVTDQPAILLNTLISMYPYGYPYVQSCMADPDNCDYRVEDTVSFAKFWQVDNASITPKMREMMYSDEIMTEERLEAYRAEMKDNASRTIDLANNGKAFIELAVPSIARNIRYGERWLQDVATQLKDVLGQKNLDADTRERIEQEHQFYSWMRQYEAWVKAVYVEVKGTRRRIADKDIPTVLAQWSRDDDLRESYMNGVMQFISDSTIALGAIPAWYCPQCQKDIPEELRDRKYYDLIPLDIAQLFFTLNSIQKLMENQSKVL